MPQKYIFTADRAQECSSACRCFHFCRYKNRQNNPLKSIITFLRESSCTHYDNSRFVLIPSEAERRPFSAGVHCVPAGRCVDILCVGAGSTRCGSGPSHCHRSWPGRERTAGVCNPGCRGSRDVQRHRKRQRGRHCAEQGEISRRCRHRGKLMSHRWQMNANEWTSSTERSWSGLKKPEETFLFALKDSNYVWH